MDSKTIIPFSPGKQFAEFALDASTTDYQLMLLPDEHVIVINVQSGHFVLVNWDERFIVLDGLFRDLELQLMLTLLNAWPSYVPLKKVLHAIFDSSIEGIEELFELNQARVLATVDRLVHACNVQLAPAGLMVQKVEDVGYKVGRSEKRGQEWPTVTEEQRRRDQEIRLEQAESRRTADAAIREAGRTWATPAEQGVLQ